MQNGRGWADRRLFMVGGGEWGRGVLPPPLENEKKEAVKRNCNLFHLYFTNEIRGRSTYTAYMQNGRGWADRRLFMVGGGEWGRGVLPPPLENEKKEAVKRNFNLFHLYFTNEIRGWADRRLPMVGGGAWRRGVLPPPP